MIKPNWRGIAKTEGYVMAALAVAVLPSLLMCLNSDSRYLAEIFSVILLICILLAIVFLKLGEKMKNGMGMRDGMLTVFLAWISACILGTAPYYCSGVLPNLMEAFFQSVSGFTTTAVDIIPDIEVIPKAILMWRSETQWLGGVGILVLIVSILPAYGSSSDSILSAELPGGRRLRLTARSTINSRAILMTYLLLTLVNAILMIIGGVGLFDSVTLAFSNISSAGFTNYRNGLMHFGSFYIEAVTAVFMFLACIPFTIYGNLGRREWSRLRDNTEVKVYIAVLAVASVLVAADLSLSGVYGSSGEALRYGVFETISFATTTGHSAADAASWPAFSRLILTLVSCIGGCAMSTGGGLKVFRIVVAAKLIKRSFTVKIHPSAVVGIKVDKEPVKSNVANAAVAYIMTYVAVLLLGTLVLSTQTPGMADALGIAGAMLSNTGISFASLGFASGYAGYSGIIQFVMCILMLAGRLEIYTLFMIFTRDFWNLDR